MKGRLFAILLALVAACVALGACTANKMDVEPKVDFAGLKITVWDLSMPDIEGLPDYEAQVSRIVREFAAASGVEVEIRFAGRQEISDRLMGKTGGEVDLVCTGEWPFIPEGARDLAGLCPGDAYMGPAAAYWRKDGRLLAVPAYVHWTATAYRTPGTECAYSWDSPLFLTAALWAGEPLPEPEEVVSYLASVLEEYGEAVPDPFRSWEDGTAKSFYPFTPYLWQRLRAKGETAEIGPVRRPAGEPGYFYTVPGYVVLSEDPAEVSCAAKLGCLLAANLGRWAARGLSCVPALREDVSVFNLESGLGFEERSAMLVPLTASGLAAPTAGEHSLWESIEPALRVVAKEYLSKEITEEEARRGILETLERHTKP